MPYHKEIHEPYKRDVEPDGRIIRRQTILSAGLVLLIVASGMTLYECLKQTIWPNITIWQSHTITIVFSSILATLTACFFVRRQIVIRLQLKEKDRLQSAAETAGAVCHEINQPLQYIMSQLELLLAKEEPYHDIRPLIVNILKEVQRIGEITWRLRNITEFRTTEYVGSTKILDLDKSAPKEKVPPKTSFD